MLNVFLFYFNIPTVLCIIYFQNSRSDILITGSVRIWKVDAVNALRKYKKLNCFKQVQLFILSTSWGPKSIFKTVFVQTSLLCRLHAKTLPNATPPIGKIHSFCKMAITIEPLMGSWCPLGFRKLLTTMAYPKDPWIVPYPLATFKCSQALTRWTCADFFKNWIIV